MGMDVYGKRPRSEAGKYFRANVWGWCPLWDYCCLVAPELTDKVKYGHSNDGDGLRAVDSRKLAKILQDELASGRTALAEMSYKESLDALPDEECDVCGGTGKRAEPPNVGPGKIKCNGCNGCGKRRPFAVHYDFETNFVKEFAEFLQDCGGFEIW